MPDVPEKWSAGLRFLGFLPLCFFLAHLSLHASRGTPGNILWLCNFSNLTLAFGLLLPVPALVRVSFLWLLAGLPLWGMDVMKTGDHSMSTLLSHVGGLTVGGIALRRIRPTRRMWIQAWFYALLLQGASRLLTTPDLNVNAAFRIYRGWDEIFTSYPYYWIASALQAAFSLWILTVVLCRLLPERPETAEVHHKTNNI